MKNYTQREISCNNCIRVLQRNNQQEMIQRYTDIGLCHSSVGKESACNAEDLGSVAGSGRSPGEGNGNLLQHSCLENPKNRGAWQATVHGVTRVRHNLVTKPPPPQKQKETWFMQLRRIINPYTCKATRQKEFSITLGRVRLSVPLRPLGNRLRSTHTEESNLLYSVYQFKH